MNCLKQNTVIAFMSILLGTIIIAAQENSQTQVEAGDISIKTGIFSSPDQSPKGEIGLISTRPSVGEQIDWEVVSSGGNIDGNSTSFQLSGTAGQSAAGAGNSNNSYGLQHGFWQDFVSGCCDTPGDANNDGTCNIGDEVFLGNFIFRSDRCDSPPGSLIGCPPECQAEGDANGDGNVNVGDEVYLGNYIFRPPPASPFPQCGPEK